MAGLRWGSSPTCPRLPWTSGLATACFTGLAGRCRGPGLPKASYPSLGTGMLSLPLYSFGQRKSLLNLKAKGRNLIRWKRSLMWRRQKTGGGDNNPLCHNYGMQVFSSASDNRAVTMHLSSQKQGCSHPHTSRHQAGASEMYL